MATISYGQQTQKAPRTARVTADGQNARPMMRFSMRRFYDTSMALTNAV
ncbi:hypothetical protein [Pandoraea commovens]|uniref:Uncharacterized protein n=1 Tax=Pandoraea commovens TaxID=2508289 RepID=A0ABY5QDB1_9BURK|nr:hypothetical protein [Pandoraea commovens]UVA78485.1 hypothetical protein NTU39_20885 [Pandoraea commovens]